MVLSSTYSERLPPRAWLLSVDSGAAIATLQHGCDVETTETSFFEAVWDGPASAVPDFSSAFFGTGGWIVGDRMLIRSSIYKKHCVYLYRTSEATLASNSLPFLLAMAGTGLSEHEWYIRRWRVAQSLGLRSMSAGLHSFPVSGGNVDLAIHSAVWIAAGQLLWQPLLGPEIYSRPSFDEYLLVLTRALDQIVRNAADQARRSRLSDCIVTLSSGYDSGAVAVVAREVAINSAVTLSRCSEDSGEPIGRALGYNVTVVDRLDTLDARDIATICAMPGNAAHFPWLSMRKHFEGKLVLTGWHGDTMWSKSLASSLRSECANIAGQAGLTEARLWMRCAFAPIVCLGDAFQHTLVSLSNSPELADGTIDAGYDRPIPRRLARLAGVESLLATKKLGTSAEPLAKFPSSIATEIVAIAKTLKLTSPQSFISEAAKLYRQSGWPESLVVKQITTDRLISEASFHWATRQLASHYRRVAVKSVASF